MDAALADLARLVAPGFGKFGFSDNSNLVLDLNCVVDRVSISIVAPDREILNIYRPMFYDEAGAEIDVVKAIDLSSVFKNVPIDEAFRAATSGGIIHTKREVSPSLVLILKSPVFVSRIVIRNRGDEYGSRSKYLFLRAFLGESNVYSYDNTCPKRRVDFLNNLCGRIGYSLHEALSGMDVERVASEIKGEIYRRSETSDLGLSFRELIALLPWSKQVDISEYEISLSATAILDALGGREKVPMMRIATLASVLGKHSLVEQVQAKIKSRVGRDIVLSKHEIHFSTMVKNKDKYMYAISVLVNIFNKSEIPLVISYGTLLGGVREGKFLDHDDDVDMLYWDGSASKEEMSKNQHEIVALLKVQGVKVYSYKPGSNVHVFIGGVSIDLFPSWCENDELHLMMEGMRYRPIARDIVFSDDGLSSVALFGERFPAPTRPEEFLAERYGAGWQVPDVYYEWPWAVDREG